MSLKSESCEYHEHLPPAQAVDRFSLAMAAVAFAWMVEQDETNLGEPIPCSS